MKSCIVSTRNTFESWRSLARELVSAVVPPEEIVWQFEGGVRDDLFSGAPVTVSSAAHAMPLRVPSSFVKLAEAAVCHSHGARFAMLYRILWRLREESGLMQQRNDRELAQVATLCSEVRRDMHKMKAFVRFREAGSGKTSRRLFHAWFEPSHNVVEVTAPFFERRFADMDWIIATPRGTASCRSGKPSFDPLPARQLDVEDVTEELWTTYYASIFNPARLKVNAMQSEMPRKYWKNLPEAALIPVLIATAEKRAREMQAKAPTLPSPFAVRARALPAAVKTNQPPAIENLPALHEAARCCSRCPLHLHATQAVVGEGRHSAGLMFVGEQPGDKEDLKGVPLIGPAGEVFDAALSAAGILRSQSYVTNAVKHFKFKPVGQRRLHQTPSVAEVQHCRWWLMEEVRLVSPRLIVAMGATALNALTGNGRDVGHRRGQIEPGPQGIAVLPTLHPAAILRHPDAETRALYREFFFADIALASKLAA